MRRGINVKYQGRKKNDDAEEIERGKCIQKKDRETVRDCERGGHTESSRHSAVV